MAASPSPFARAGSGPELAFRVEGVSAMERAAVPTLGFALRIDASGGAQVRSILLHTQVQIAARRRRYGPQDEERLFELFGQPERWGTTLGTLPWTRHTQVVPAFTGSTAVEVPVPCTYDFDVAASRYLQALDDGAVPLELLFGGTVFYAGEGGLLQTAQIAWDREAAYDLPVSVWRETMDLYFPGTTWLRLGKATFARLHAFRSRRALTSWDEAIDSLLAAEGEE
jgi:Family of unknown function (DUF6084)